MRKRWLGFVCLCIPLVIGCGSPEGQTSVQAPEMPSVSEEPATAEPAAPEPAAQPAIQVANWEETQELIAQHTGKVVILDLWASW